MNSMGVKKACSLLFEKNRFSKNTAMSFSANCQEPLPISASGSKTIQRRAEFSDFQPMPNH